MRRTIANLLILAVAALAVFAPAASAQYSDILLCSFSVVEPGGTEQASGEGFLPGSPVILTITDEALPSYTVGAASTDSVSSAFSRAVLQLDADADGTFNATFVIPADTPPGDYFVLADGTGVDGEPRALVCQVEVASEIDEIAFTGSSTRPVAQIALAVIAFGALLVFATRRTRDTAPADALD